MSKIEEFYSRIYKLSYITRYSSVPRIKDESVAEHSFYVASLVIELSKYYKFDVGKATIMAIAHDWPEAVTGDVTIEVKRKYPKIADAVDVATMDEIRKYDTFLKDIMLDHLAIGSVEATIVLMADIVQCAQYASHEIKLGNTGYMTKVLESATKRLHEVEVLLNEHRK